MIVPGTVLSVRTTSSSVSRLQGQIRTEYYHWADISWTFHLEGACQLQLSRCERGNGDGEEQVEPGQPQILTAPPTRLAQRREVQLTQC